MEPRIEILSGLKLIGKRMRMSLSANKTGELWKSFMQQRNLITNAVGTNLYSVQIYAPSYFDRYNPSLEFEKWAAAEVPDFSEIPEGMEALEVPGGSYAVFLYRGNPNAGAVIFQYIFGTWLPGSDYLTDNRPHFEILGDNYRNDDPGSEEEIWVPIKSKHL